ncbi:hypothetical protein MSAN_01724700 [Mycena sanguinolenta]|uniref:Uncharacterized protein n=1 Tax=Mycena sanguinolenta TaxID=230812 RepID=A0A8H6XZ03_9AGAR|nr:hypothetical protein MSAN_01724700 [Mycena sanguinolenta]
MAHDLGLRDSLEVGSVATIRNVFYGLELAGLVGAVVMLLTAIIWRKIVRRHASWFNFMVTWIISCSSYIFLLGESVGRTPNHSLCLSQAALIFSVPTLTSAATSALVIHVYLTMRQVLTMSTHCQASWTTALLIGPYIPTLAMLIFCLRLALHNPSLVFRPDDGTYCTFNTKLPGRVSGIVVVVIMLFCLAIEIIIFRHLRRAWKILKKENCSSISTIVRVLAFTLVGMLSIILSLLIMVIPNSLNSAFNIVIAIVPVSSVLIFGTQKDIFTAWASGFRCRETHGTDTWDTFTPHASLRTITRQVSGTHESHV